MDTNSLPLDVGQIAKAASSYYLEMVQFGVGPAEFTHYKLADTLKYNINRLTGLGLITSEEQDTLNGIAEQTALRANASGLGESLQAREGVSPLAAALAGVIAASPAEFAAENLSGALVGALLGFGSFRQLLSGAGSELALVSILAALGGAAACGSAAAIKAHSQPVQTAIA